jgi:hypothetical protein
MSQTWKLCSSCKKPINYGATWYKCSVSTCNRTRTALYFCTIECWQAHVPGARHRDAWAEPEQAPANAAQAARLETNSGEGSRSAEDAARARRVVTSATVQAVPARPDPGDSQEILVVVSKLKKYIKDRSGMNTSDGAMAVLSAHLRALSNEAIRTAARDGRKTVLDRDFPPPTER